MQKPIPQRRCISYKKNEAKFFQNVEKKLCADLGLTESDLYKTAVKKLYNDRQVLEMVQRHETNKTR